MKQRSGNFQLQSINHENKLRVKHSEHVLQKLIQFLGSCCKNLLVKNS